VDESKYNDKIEILDWYREIGS